MTTPPEFPYFVIEHQDNEEFPRDGWSYIEYLNILRVATPQRVIITNMVPAMQKSLGPEFKQIAAVTHHSVLDFIYNKNDINNNTELPECLRNIHKYHSYLPQQKEGVEPTLPQADENGQTPNIILDNTLPPSQVCFLDEFGTGPLEPTDLGKFQYIITGGVLGDHPSVDKCAYLRHHNFQVRHLGPRQMSTDTAVLACCVVLRHNVQIDDLDYLDDPEVYDDEIDQIPKVRKNGQRGESTAVRMRYLTHQQPKIDEDPTKKQPQNIVCYNPLKCDELLTKYNCMCDCPECIEQKKQNEIEIGEKNKCNINHAGDWYHSRPQKQFDLYQHKACKIARITPDLLEHIFDSMNNGLFDLDGALDIDFEAMELGIDEAEDKELCKILFGDE